jgi:voltage-gated sodium channel
VTSTDATMNSEAAPRGNAFARRIVEHRWFEPFFIFCIFANALLLGVDAHSMGRSPFHHIIVLVDHIFLGLFVVELVLKWSAYGTRSFFSQGWNIFDLIVVIASFLPALPGLSALRALRVLRIFRLFRVIPEMRRVVEALMTALPGITAALAILAVFFYIGAVVATTLYGVTNEERFGGLDKSALTLFQLTLFDDWGSVVRAVMDNHPSAWLFFVSFTAIAAFAVLNLFIGVIVDAVQTAQTKIITEELGAVEKDVEKVEAGIAEGASRDPPTRRQNPENRKSQGTRELLHALPPKSRTGT